MTQQQTNLGTPLMKHDNTSNYSDTAIIVTNDFNIIIKINKIIIKMCYNYVIIKYIAAT